MTTVSIYRQDGHIVRVIARGHANFAARGRDIVCAAVSSLVQAALLGLTDVAGADVKSARSDGFLQFDILENNTDKRHSADIILDTMRLAIKDIASGYKAHIKLEEIENVY